MKVLQLSESSFTTICSTATGPSACCQRLYTCALHPLDSEEHHMKVVLYQISIVFMHSTLRMYSMRGAEGELAVLTWLSSWVPGNISWNARFRPSSSVPTSCKIWMMPVHVMSIDVKSIERLHDLNNAIEASQESPKTLR